MAWHGVALHLSLWMTAAHMDHRRRNFELLLYFLYLNGISKVTIVPLLGNGESIQSEAF